MTALRPLETRDIAAVQGIDQAVYGESWSTRSMHDQVSDDQFDHRVAVDQTGRVIGHAATWLRGSALTVTTVAVDEAGAGHGVATRLLVALLSDIDPGIHELRLEVRPANRRAQRLYSRFGFAPISVVRNFYDRAGSDGSRDALVMLVADPHSEQWCARLAAIGRELDEQAGAAA